MWTFRRNFAGLAVCGLLGIGLSGCGGWTDPATRLAADLRTASGQLGSQNGSALTMVHGTPSRTGECEGPYLVQIDRVGAIIVWCRDDTGTTVSSHSTSSHGGAVVTPQTYLLAKGAGEALEVDLKRVDGKAVISGVR